MHYPSSVQISINIPRLQLAWNLNLAGKLINPYNFQGRLVKSLHSYGCNTLWATFAMEMLSLPATQEYLVSKMAFSAPHLVPFSNS